MVRRPPRSTRTDTSVPTRRSSDLMAGIDDAAERVVTATSRFISIVVKERDWAAILFGSAELLPDARQDMYRYLRNDLERGVRSEEHTSELQSLMRISYAVFCLKKKNKYKKCSIARDRIQQQ